MDQKQKMIDVIEALIDLSQRQQASCQEDMSCPVEIIFSEEDLELYSLGIDDVSKVCDYILKNTGEGKNIAKALSEIKVFYRPNILGENTKYYSLEVDPGSLRDFIVFENDIAFAVDFVMYRDILINGIKIKNFKASSQSQEVFEYAFDHSGEWVTYQELVDNSGFDDRGNLYLTRTINDLVDDWNFKGVLRKIFVRAGKNKLMLRKYITNKNLKEESATFEEVMNYLLNNFSKK